MTDAPLRLHCRQDAGETQLSVFAEDSMEVMIVSRGGCRLAGPDRLRQDRIRQSMVIGRAQDQRSSRFASIASGMRNPKGALLVGSSVLYTPQAIVHSTMLAAPDRVACGLRGQQGHEMDRRHSCMVMTERSAGSVRPPAPSVQGRIGWLRVTRCSAAEGEADPSCSAGKTAG